jgi:DNA-binding CsgD family transcriptional regulator/PAS domain-containing protein
MLTIIDDLGIIIASTKEFSELCGYSLDQIYLQNWWADLTSPESMEAELKALANSLEKPLFQYYEKNLIRADGATIQVRILARRCQWLFLLDISPIDHSDIYVAYESSALSIESDLGLDSAIVVTDLDDLIRVANCRALRLFGCDSEGELIGQPALRFVAGDLSGESRNWIASAREGLSVDGTFRLLRDDKRICDVRLRSLPLFHRGRFHGTINFLRAMKPSEESDGQDATGICKRAWLAPLLSIDSLPAALCSLKPDGTIAFANDYGRSFLSIGDEEITKGISIFERLRENSVGRFRGVLDQVLRGADVKPLIMDAETPEGEFRPAIWCLGLDLSRDGILALAVDATDAFASSLVPDEEFYMLYGLTAREREVSDLLVLGYEYKEIGERLGIALPTVRSHAQAAYAKMGIHSKAELVEAGSRWRVDGGQNDCLASIARILQTRT